VSQPAVPAEEIYVLRSIGEPAEPVVGACAADRAGFEPFPTAGERFFSFWSVRTAPESGRVIEAKEERVAQLHGCFGPGGEPALQKFHAQIELGAVSFRGDGECSAVQADFPQAGLFPVHCWLVLSGLPAPYVGGLLTTNTLKSKAAFGGASEPPGYTQASIATIRLWKSNERTTNDEPSKRH
jgi:hypothetical protein